MQKKWFAFFIILGLGVTQLEGVYYIQDSNPIYPSGYQTGVFDESQGQNNAVYNTQNTSKRYASNQNFPSRRVYKTYWGKKDAMSFADDANDKRYENSLQRFREEVTTPDPGVQDNPYYSLRRYHQGDWDNQQNWRYYREAYLRGETQPEYYRNTHLENRGGIGYDPDFSEQYQSPFIIPDREAAESYYYRQRRGQDSNEQRYQQRVYGGGVDAYGYPEGSQNSMIQDNKPRTPRWDQQ